MAAAPRAPRPRSERGGGERGASRDRTGSRDRTASRIWPAITLIVLALIASATGTFFWSAPLWGTLAPHWPGGGYGFAVTVGLLLPLVIGGAGAAWLRMRGGDGGAGGASGPVGVLGWGAGVCAGGAAAVFLLALQLGAIRPKRRNRDADCYEVGGACWIGEQYPLAWLAGVLAIPVGILLLLWCAGRIRKRRGTEAPTGDRGTHQDP
ncbi:hypothetical protein RCO28_10880 [Streptomyces sp. LHD-70]|uniref:hypothetical protein n=1 Tax=Streptomyces sp. LHD-70 TaxID=3072140 RepID=UPI00280CF948|nr:hypothetical protein [Streptomyces sp. LHD-70]MDQ8702988.1 hypothetical protein [Streptomyces sp. LHD-70]